MNGYTEGDADCSYSWCMNLRGSKSFGISVYTEKAISYLITARYGANTAGQSIDVAVNGYKQVEKAPVDVTGEKYPCTDGHVIGIVNLNRGMNEVTFSLGAGSNNAVVMDSVQFALADSFQEGVFTAWVQENRVPEYFFPAEANSGFYTAGGQKCATMRATSWVEYDVYTEEERTVNMLIDMASSENITFSASVNGETQISKENIGGIIRLLMDDLNKRLSDREIKVALSPEAEHFVVEHGYDPVYGARPLKRFLQKHVETLSAKLILEDQVRQGDTILIDVKDGALTASVQK